MNDLSVLTGTNIAVLEREFLKHDQVDCDVIHRFGPGIYIREVHIPANTLAIGHHQNFEHVNVMLKGRVTVVNENGTTTELVAPMMFVGKPGRKVGYISEDMVWQNIYADTEQDVKKLEAKYLTKSDDFAQAIASRVQALQIEVDRKDFECALDDVGVSRDEAQAQSVNESDMIDLPFGGYKIKTAKSQIDGIGLFATANIDPGEVIAPARIDGKRTIAGRFTNHSRNPNAVMVINGNDINLVALTNINGCKGGIDGDEITVDYRESVRVTKQIGVTLCQV